MEIQKLLRLVQNLANDAGLDFNSMRPLKAEEKLVELKALLNKHIPDPEPVKEAEPDEATEPEDSVKEEEVKKPTVCPGPEAQPSEE